MVLIQYKTLIAQGESQDLQIRRLASMSLQQGQQRVLWKFVRTTPFSESLCTFDLSFSADIST